MHVFVTGASGWVGSAIVKDLLNAGHQVTGLVRSAEKAALLKSMGARTLQGNLSDLDALSSTASRADAVIHTAFDHDFSKFAESCEQDRRVIEALGHALAGTARPLLVTSGLLGLPREARETDEPSAASPRKSEPAARALAAIGVRAATVRLAPSVHGIGDQGFVPMLIRIAKEKGVSAYVGEGANAWSAVHLSDAARVYRLALEHGLTEPAYHAVAEEFVPFREIAQAIGDRLGVPVEPRDRSHFGWFAHFATADLCASSLQTRGQLAWTPSGPTLLSELAKPDYCND